MASVAHLITGHEQTQLNRVCYFLFFGVFFEVYCTDRLVIAKLVNCIKFDIVDCNSL